jgi:hypothetical protein
MKKVLKPIVMVLAGMWVLSILMGILAYFMGFGDKSAPIQTKTKIAAFGDVVQLQKTLSQNGIGELRKWRDDETGGFVSSSDYFSFGNLVNEYGMQNNLAYYLESPKSQFVQQLKLVLNIYNSSERAKSLAMYSEVAEKTFKSIGLELPEGLLDACKSGKEFKSNQVGILVTSKLSKSRIDTWKLTIE